MRRIRVIPVLLVKNGGLYKSEKFKNYKYIGDPINAVKIFNEKEVDEIVILDIDATSGSRMPDISLIRSVASEAFMPLAYGGGITNIQQIENILYEGVEKVIINSAAISNPSLIKEAANRIGSSSVVVSMDVTKDWLGKNRVYRMNGKKKTDLEPVDHARKVEDLGAGEIFLTSIDRDGTFSGYDYDLLSTISHAVSIPVVVCGGAGSLGDFVKGVKAGASAVAAGSMFVYQGSQKAVLINYPSQKDLYEKLYSKV